VSVVLVVMGKTEEWLLGIDTLDMNGMMINHTKNYNNGLCMYSRRSSLSPAHNPQGTQTSILAHRSTPYLVSSIFL
jgi:hypothetical protein